MAGTFQELRAIPRELAIYFGVFATLALIAEYSSAIPGIVGFLVYWFAHYLMFQALLRKAGWLEDHRVRIFRFFFMACLIGLAIAVASNFFLVPGIILAAKWIMAPAFLVARDRGLFASMGDSWEASNGNTLQLSLAFSILVGGWVLVLILAGALGRAIGPTMIQDVSAGIYLHILPVMLMGLSITAYRRLGEPRDALVEVFE